MRARDLLPEAYNPRVFRRGFEAHKEFGRYRLTAKAGYIPYVLGKFVTQSHQFRVEAHLGRQLVGWVNFEIIDDHLEALDLVVEPQHRRKGIATAMYRFARDLGNDIAPSSRQTAMGKAFWATKSPVADEELQEGPEWRGYPCTKNCQGHIAGDDWAQDRGITDPNDCPYGNSNSFWEGCRSEAEGR
jgi:GNAT superfamily N-acetyltransferase